MRILLPLIGMVLPALVAGQSTPAQPAKALEWAFEGNLRDTSGNGNHGCLSGTGGYVRGRFGWALSRCPGTTVTRPDSYGVPRLAVEPWSVNVWLRITAMPGWSQIAGFRDASGMWGSLRLIGDEGGFSLYGHNSGLNSKLAFCTDGAWHMYTATWNGVTICLYLDGKLVANGRPTEGGACNIADISQANVVVGDTGDWAGAVDEFTIWRGALSLVQVKGLYLGGPSG